MGKPVILLLRYEGGMFWSLAKDGSPWYPSMRILRQTSSGDWGAVVARTIAMLAGMRTDI